MLPNDRMVGHRVHPTDPRRMPRSEIALAIALVLPVVLAGCATAGGARDPDVAEPSRPAAPSVDESLSRAVDDISASLRILAETQNAVALKTMTPAQASQVKWQSSYVPPGMDMLMTLDWAGRPEPVIQMCAEGAGYRFTTLGKAPVQDIVIRVRAKDRPVVDVLRDVGTQMGHLGTLRIIPETKTVELRYDAAVAAR